MEINTVAALNAAAYQAVSDADILSMDAKAFRAIRRKAVVALKSDAMAPHAEKYDSAAAVIGIARETAIAATSPRIKAEAIVTLGSAMRKASALTKAVELFNK